MSLQSGAPHGFQELEEGRATAWVRPEASEWVRNVLERGDTLHQAAARSAGVQEMAGRGAVWVFSAPEGDAPGWVARHYRRGGSVASLLGDRFLRSREPRPFLELRASEEVRGRGLPTPRVLAAAVYPRGLHYRGDLVTELVPDAMELAEVLFDPERTGVAGGADRKEALQEAGQLIRKMGEAGVFHPDLNARNVLLRWYAAPDALVLDLDRCRVGSAPDRDAAGRMLMRLVRSIRKLAGKTGIHVPENEIQVLREAVG